MRNHLKCPMTRKFKQRSFGLSHGHSQDLNKSMSIGNYNCKDMTTETPNACYTSDP